MLVQGNPDSIGHRPSHDTGAAEGFAQVRRAHIGATRKAGTSSGIQEMMIFSYDLTVARLWRERTVSPGFLVHDSSIFDGVGQRQVVHALGFASERSERDGFQYICLVNSDTLPTETLDQLRQREQVKLELSDYGVDGGLFGFRF